MMGAAESHARMLKGHEIVMRIIELNSRRLHLDNKINGLDIERRVAERDVLIAGAGSEHSRVVAAISAKIEELNEQRSELTAEHDRLERVLAEFEDGTAADGPSKIGRA